VVTFSSKGDRTGTHPLAGFYSDSAGLGYGSPGNSGYHLVPAIKKGHRAKPPDILAY
jgi:hypothetical protein